MLCALWPGGCAYVRQLPPGWPSVLACRGDFAQFKNGFFDARPMALHFAVYWTTPGPVIIPLDGGAPAQVLALTPLELSFAVQYRGYKAVYRLNRVDGSFSQRPDLGGVFAGTCEFRPLTTKV